MARIHALGFFFPISTIVPVLKTVPGLAGGGANPPALGRTPQPPGADTCLSPSLQAEVAAVAARRGEPSSPASSEENSARTGDSGGGGRTE